MLAFLIRRTLISLVLLILVSMFSFAIIRFSPGAAHPGAAIMDPKKSAEAERLFREKYHFNRDPASQYVLVMRDLFKGSLKDYNDQSVLGLIGERLPWTMLLNAVSMVIVFGLGIPLGIAGARWKGGWRDSSITFGAFFLIAIPNFFISYLLCILLVKYVQVPILGLTTFGVEHQNPMMYVIDYGWHLFAPALVLALPGIAVQSRYVRASMIESLGEEYIRTARAKGLRDAVVYYKHALRNSLRPIVTFMGFLLVGMIGGSVIVETIFAYPGMGRLAFEALTKRDLPTLMAINFFAAILVILGNLLADMLYSIVDPRVRLE